MLLVLDTRIPFVLIVPGVNQVVTVTPCPGTGTADASVCIDRAFNCTPPDHCLENGTACWPSDHDVEIQCTACEVGYWVNQSQRCEACRSCPAGEYIVWPCEGYTNTVCAPCYNGGCGPCQVGFTLALNGLCSPINCQLYGCGAANINSVCKELDKDSYMCTCPNVQQPIRVVAGEGFIGCEGEDNPPTATEIIANVNVTNLEAYLIHGVIEILGAVVVDIGGDSFTLNVTATVPIDTIGDHIKKAIAAHIAGDYTAADITIRFTTKRTETGRIFVTLSDSANSASPLSFSIVGLLGLLLATQF